MTLTQANEKLAETRQAIKSLLEKSDRTAEESAHLKTLLETGEALKAERDELKKAHDFTESTKGLTDQAKAVADALAGGARDGSVTVATDEKGTVKKVLDESGGAIGAKAWNAISEPRYAKAYDLMLRGKADAHDYKVLSEAKAMVEGLDTGGGYLVPADDQDRIVQRKPHPTDILNYVMRVTTARDRVRMPKVNYTTDDIYGSGIRIAWTGENGPTAEDTAMDAGWGEVEIPIFTGSFQVEMSRDLLEDSAFDLQGWLLGEAQKVYALGIDREIVLGTGTGRPAGILRNVGAADEPPTVNLGNPVTAANIIGFTYGLPPQYAPDAVFVMNRTSVYSTLAQIANSANDFIFGLEENTKALAAGRVDRLLGYPIAFSAFMPASGAANNVLVYGDLREGYTFAERVAFSIEPYGDTDREMLRLNRRGFHFRFRVGGAVVQPRALRVGVQS